MSLSPCRWPIPCAEVMRAYCEGLVDLDTAVTASCPVSSRDACATTFFAAALSLWYVAPLPLCPGAVEPPAWATAAMCIAWACIAAKRWRDYLRDRAAHRAAVHAVADAWARHAAARPAPADG